MRIAIVNDVSLAVDMLRHILAAEPDLQIAWVAHNGADAVEKCASDTPDLILMDLLMPVMDGVEATRRIMAQSPCAILIVTASVFDHTTEVFDAMGHGALDAVDTPVLGPGGLGAHGHKLIARIEMIGKLIGKPLTAASPHLPEAERPRRPPATTLRVVAIGASTGGPHALAEVLSCFPPDLSAAVAVIEHVDVQFAPSLVHWLSLKSALPVQLARAGSSLEMGHVLIAGSNDHLVLKPNLTLAYTPEPRDYPYRPSIDAFFGSLAEYWPGGGVGVLLTGMGTDGAAGLMRLRSAGWHTIAQDEESSAIYGMPKAAAEMGAAVEILPIQLIAPAILRSINLGKRHG